MKRLTTAAGMAAMVLLAARDPAAAQEPPKNYFELHGRCTKLSVLGQDQTGTCKTTVLNPTYGNGLVSYWFFFGDTILAMSGSSETALPHDYTLHIDTARLIQGGQQKAEMKVTGKCNFRFQGTVLEQGTLNCELMDPQSKQTILASFQQEKSTLHK